MRQTKRIVKGPDGALRLVVTTSSEFDVEVNDDLIALAKGQYRSERDAAGDPPYSIGNEWLLHIGEKVAAEK